MLRHFFFSLSLPGAVLLQSLRVAEPAEATVLLLRRMLELPFAIPILGRHRLRSLPGSPAVDVPKISFRGFPTSWEAGRSHCKPLWGAGLWLEGNAGEGLVTASTQWDQGGGMGGGLGSPGLMVERDDLRGLF